MFVSGQERLEMAPNFDGNIFYIINAVTIFRYKYPVYVDGDCWNTRANPLPFLILTVQNVI